MVLHRVLFAANPETPRH